MKKNKLLSFVGVSVVVLGATLIFCNLTNLGNKSEEKVELFSDVDEEQRYYFLTNTRVKVVDKKIDKNTNVMEVIVEMKKLKEDDFFPRFQFLYNDSEENIHLVDRKGDLFFFQIEKKDEQKSDGMFVIHEIASESPLEVSEEKIDSLSVMETIEIPLEEKKIAKADVELKMDREKELIQLEKEHQMHLIWIELRESEIKGLEDRLLKTEDDMIKVQHMIGIEDVEGTMNGLKRTIENIKMGKVMKENELQYLKNRKKEIEKIVGMENGEENVQ